MPNEKSKETIRAKCSSYLERAEKLKQYLKGGKKKAVADGGSSSKKWEFTSSNEFVVDVPYIT